MNLCHSADLLAFQIDMQTSLYIDFLKVPAVIQTYALLVQWGFSDLQPWKVPPPCGSTCYLQYMYFRNMSDVHELMYWPCVLWYLGLYSKNEMHMVLLHVIFACSYVWNIHYHLTCRLFCSCAVQTWQVSRLLRPLFRPCRGSKGLTQWRKSLKALSWWWWNR